VDSCLWLLSQVVPLIYFKVLKSQALKESGGLVNVEGWPCGQGTANGIRPPQGRAS